MAVSSLWPSRLLEESCTIYSMLFSKKDLKANSPIVSWELKGSFWQWGTIKSLKNDEEEKCALFMSKNCRRIYANQRSQKIINRTSEFRCRLTGEVKRWEIRKTKLETRKQLCHWIHTYAQFLPKTENWE